MTYCMDHKYEVFLRATKEVVETPSWSGSKELGNCILESVSAKFKGRSGRMQRCTVFSFL